MRLLDGPVSHSRVPTPGQGSERTRTHRWIDRVRIESLRDLLPNPRRATNTPVLARKSYWLVGSDGSLLTQKDPET